MKSSELNIELTDDKLIISIGRDTLLHALMMSPDWPMDFVVLEKDEQEFLTDLVRYGLQDEDEDGTTPVHRMLDAAALEVLEQGFEGVTEFPGDDDGLALEKRLTELRARMSAE